MSSRKVLLRSVILAGCAAGALILTALLTSRSETGLILGRWSAGMFTLIAMVVGMIVLGSLTFIRGSLPAWLLTLCRKLPEITGAMLLLFLPLFVFLTWFLFPVPLFQRTTFTAGLFLCSLLPGLLVILSQEAGRIRKVAAGTVILTISLFVTLLAAELALRLVMPGSIFDPRFGLRPYQRVDLQVNLRGVEPGGTFTTNKWGFRGEEPPVDWDDYLTIVTIGGSTTANYYLDDGLTWSHVLQTELRDVNPRVWVGNAGIPRHSAATHSLFVREVLPSIRPDVALFLVGVNDMGPFRGRGVVEERLPESGIRPWLFRESRILQLLYKLKKTYIEGAPVITGTVDPYFVEEPMTGEEPPMPGDLHLLLDEPDYYMERIRKLIRDCRELDILPVFMTQPSLYDDTEYWRGILARQIWTGEGNREISAATNWRMLQTLNADLIRVCEEENVPVFDLAGSMPHSRDYFYDSMHMTERGADFVGTFAAVRLAEYLEDEGLLQADTSRQPHQEQEGDLQE